MFYHIKNLQSTKTDVHFGSPNTRFYHIKNLQSTKTSSSSTQYGSSFYHIKNLQSTKTGVMVDGTGAAFYHIKNLQSTKTRLKDVIYKYSFITLRIYKVLKHSVGDSEVEFVLSH